MSLINKEHLSLTLQAIKMLLSGKLDKSEFREYLKSQLSAAKDYVILKDAINGYEYIVRMKDGELTSVCMCDSVVIATHPIKKMYQSGEYFDPTGMTLMGIRQDGSTFIITDYTYSSNAATSSDAIFEIYYEEGGRICSVGMAMLTEAMLIDFEYVIEEDGSCTLTGWKGTLNGIESTEFVVPDSAFINFKAGD